MSDPKIGTRDQWNAARSELLVREKELTRMSDELARQRRDLPWVPVDKDYAFQTADGPKTLEELFDGRSQLAIYHFMFGPDWVAGCPVCSSIADSFNGVVPHLAARDVTMICVARAPIEKLVAYRERMGWDFDWASSYQSDFNDDFERTHSREQASEWAAGVPPFVGRLASDCGTDTAGYLSELPGLSVFARSAGDVYLTYATTARGLDAMMEYYTILDRVPHGRDESDGGPSWLHRTDEYGGEA